jgi:rhodanese-related sulfurtransferase
VNLAIGVGFGFVLERAGFGSSKKLTSQFYLNDMSVLKVMFTAIITCLVLITATSATGLMSFDKLWVNPTYLASGIIGGFIFGVGFVIGGYCPGTALTAVATLKLDALGFIVGLLGGILTFGYTLPSVDHLFNDVTNLGRFTLDQWLGLPMPVVTALVVVMALGFFAAAEAVERWMRRGRGDSQPPPRSHWPRTMALSLAGLSALSLVLWAPLRPLRTHNAQSAIERSIAQLKVAIEPDELAELMRDRTQAFALFDLRSESEFNRFHLLDAERVTPGSLDRVGSVPQKTIKIMIASDERQAADSYRSLASTGAQNIYWLHGGMNAWTGMLRKEQPGFMLLASALGAEQPGSRPVAKHAHAPMSNLVHKIVRAGGGAAKSGGCGG